MTDLSDLVSKSSIWIRRALALLSLVVLCSCSGSCGGGPDPVPWSKVVPKSGQEQRPAPPRTSDHLVVYLDASGSMAGYVSPDGGAGFAASPDGQTVFSRTLQELRTVVTSLSPPVSVVFRPVAAAVAQPSFSDIELGRASINRGFYNGGETNLAGAVNLFTQPLQSAAPKAANGDGDDEPPPPARYHILITDGVQSTKQQRADVSCMAGSDYRCVRNVIGNLLRQGWAGAVLGVRSEFRGKIFSELKQGLSVQYESKTRDPKTFRPFYLYIFSPDQAGLDRLVESLKERLRATLKQEDAVREYALTSRYSDGAGTAELRIPKESTSYLERSKAREENPPRLTLRVDVDAERKGPQPFEVAVSVPWSNHARDGGTPQELASLVRWELVEVPIEGERGASRSRLPEVKLTGQQQTDEQGQIIVQATAHWPQGTGTPDWRVYRLVGHLDLNRKAPPWVQQWSTNLDTSIEQATKTFNLESALSDLWRNPVMESQAIADIYLRVGPS